MAPDLAARVSHRLDRIVAAGPLAVACSGGSDSLALLLLASDWARRTARTLQVLTVDHGLRAESAAEAAFVADRARRLGHEAVTLTWTGDKPVTGLQDAARHARHRLLARACAERGVRTLLLAHTLDDQAETVWMRLAAGGGWRGAAGMREAGPSPVWPEGRGLSLLRPLLAERRCDLRAWLTDRDETWIDDPSNEDRRYARTRIRERLARFEAAGFDPVRIAGLAGGMAALNAVEARAAWRLARSAAHLTRWGGLALDRQQYGQAPAVIRHRLLEAAVLAVSGRETLPGRDALTRLDNSVRAGECATAGGVMAAPWRGRTWLVRDPGAVLGRVDRSGVPPMQADGVWDGRFAVTGLPPGMTAGALGRSYDGLEDRAILSDVPGFARASLMAVRAGGRSG